MKKTSLLIIQILLTITAHAQTGIHFEKGLSWQQILDKAKAEHKYIFVDCYATWCGPCKMMDKDIYPQAAAGDTYNPDFIAVRIQMDQTVKDNDTVKSWYETAKMLGSMYQVNAYPTFLFFDDNGKAVTKATGSLRLENFIQLAKDARNPDKQYYTLLTAYKSGTKNYGIYRALADMAENLGEKDISKQLTQEYIHRYLNQLSEQQFLTEGNITFMAYHENAISSKSRIFKLCYNEPAKVDTAIHYKEFAQRLVNDVVIREEIQFKVDKGKKAGTEPDWNHITRAIKTKYPNLDLEDDLLTARVNWYHFKKDGSNYGKYIIERAERGFEKNGFPKKPSGIQLLTYNDNNMLIFQYDTTRKDLETALGWQEKVVASEVPPIAGDMDTEANLLYKLGRKGEAIKVEAEAVAKAPNDRDIAANYQKMQAGEHTWPDKME